MQMMKILFPALIQQPPAQPASERWTSTSADYEAIDAYVEEQMQRLNIPGGSLAIVEGDQIVHLRGFGKANPGGEAPTPQTPFFIGSLTKSFTALAVMQLVEAGKVELDAPVQRYLPWFRVADPQASAQMTVRHLLNQTSGIPTTPGLVNLGNLDRRPGAAERQVRALSKVKLTRPVGARFEYSNTNYDILGLIVETASRESYSDHVQRQIFDALEMHHSYVSKAVAQRDRLAAGHTYWFGFPIPIPDLDIPCSALASGQLIASAEDMAHYLIAHLNGGSYGGKHVLSEAGIAELTRGAAEWIEMGASLGYYGMGWVSQETGGVRIVSHSGTVPDFAAFMALIPMQKKGVVLLFNANHAMMKITLDQVGMGTAQRLAGAPFPPQVFGAALWLMRSMLLIPILQIADVFTTLRLLFRWKDDPAQRPSRGRMWGRHILLPLATNLLTALTLVPMLSKMRGFIKFFMPDFSWIAWICGGFAAIWAFLRTGLMLRAMRDDS